MTIEILDEAIAFIESLKAKLSPAATADVKAVQNAGHDIVKRIKIPDDLHVTPKLREFFLRSHE